VLESLIKIDGVVNHVGPRIAGGVECLLDVVCSLGLAWRGLASQWRCVVTGGDGTACTSKSIVIVFADGQRSAGRVFLWPHVAKLPDKP